MGVAVVLVRGINVGSTRKVPMERLRRICVAAGGRNVETYIQSGNAVLESDVAPEDLETRIEAGMAAEFPFEASVLVRTGPEWLALAAGGAFPEVTDGTKRAVWLMRSEPPSATWESVDPSRFAPERFEVRGREVFLALPGGQGRSKLCEALGRATKGLVTTARNWKTVEALAAMVEARSGGGAAPR